MPSAPVRVLDRQIQFPRTPPADGLSQAKGSLSCQFWSILDSVHRKIRNRYLAWRLTMGSVMEPDPDSHLGEVERKV
ncbi:Hypothetical predicted protein [Olea europaea subsp. europaea]|uniref:Uncharacterized protein n=1 Tax=Olea europaea subsp. europaea TaxID=158383 RepID=A0A8S0V574_OLEEU|nr:Hypothetical predicted protein [Olea europaea subsp. europaea]